MIEYIKLFWEGAPEGEPSVILYEVNTVNDRLALRSIDISADGRTRNIPDLWGIFFSKSTLTFNEKSLTI